MFLLAASMMACGRGPDPPDLASLGPLDPAVKTLLDERTAAVRAARSDATSWGGLGTAFEANGLLAAAETAYAEAARLDSREPRWLYRIALLRARRGDLDGALADMDRVIHLAPTYAPARWHRGQWLLDRGEVPGAESAFRAVLQSVPNDPAASAGLARVFLARGENAAAVKEYRHRPGACPEGPPCKSA